MLPDWRLAQNGFLDVRRVQSLNVILEMINPFIAVIFHYRLARVFAVKMMGGKSYV